MKKQLLFGKFTPLFLTKRVQNDFTTYSGDQLPLFVLLPEFILAKIGPYLERIEEIIQKDKAIQKKQRYTQS